MLYWIIMLKEAVKNGSNMLGQAEKVQTMNPAQASSTLVLDLSWAWPIIHLINQ
jgi:hypothetical protein